MDARVILCQQKHRQSETLHIEVADKRKLLGKHSCIMQGNSATSLDLIVRFCGLMASCIHQPGDLWRFGAQRHADTITTIALADPRRNEYHTADWTVPDAVPACDIGCVSICSLFRSHC